MSCVHRHVGRGSPSHLLICCSLAQGFMAVDEQQVCKHTRSSDQIQVSRGTCESRVGFIKEVMFVQTHLQIYGDLMNEAHRVSQILRCMEGYPWIKCETICPAAKALQKLGHASGKWSQSHQHICTDPLREGRIYIFLQTSERFKEHCKEDWTGISQQLCHCREILLLKVVSESWATLHTLLLHFGWVFVQ